MCSALQPVLYKAVFHGGVKSMWSSVMEVRMFRYLDTTLRIYIIYPREVLMGVGDGVASVIMLTFTKRPGPHADFYKEARPPC